MNIIGMSKQIIKVFGNEADSIKKGDIFIATIDSVEGRTVVKLVKETDDALLDYVWETPSLVDTLKDWIEADYTPAWSDRD